MSLVGATAVACIASLVLCPLTILLARFLHLGIDESRGVQKQHSHWVPRLGGIPILLAAIAGLLSMGSGQADGVSQHDPALLLFVALIPAFAAGLTEDLTGQVGAAARWFFTAISAALGWWLVDAGLFRLDIPGVDTLIAHHRWLAFAVTVVAVAGVAHAANIIDGCNGLSGFICSLALVLLGAVALMVNDRFVAQLAFVSAGAVCGFMFWNFPFGRIFLGDAGAYMLGFIVAEVSVLLVVRNPSVSAWFPLLLMLYPIWETVFSMYRRSRYGGLAQISRADALHLHHLILRRIVRFVDGRHRKAHGKMRRNSTASACACVLALLCGVPAFFFWDNTSALMLFSALFIGLYMSLYSAIVRFRVPRRLLELAPANRSRSREAREEDAPFWPPK